jgi:hypothetical protein
LLAVGQANGVSKGAEFAIYPLGTTDLTKKEDRISIATIIQRGGSQSLCKLEPIAGKERQVEQGDQAVQISASVNLVRTVSLIPKDDPALLAIANALLGNGWVELSEDGAGIDYIVSINDKGEYEICDSGDQLFKNINPPARIADPDAPAKVVNRLVHLAKYKATSEIDNADTDSPLSGKLAVEWLGTSDTFDTGDPIPKKEKLTQFADPNRPTVKVGEYVFLAIRNDSTQPLNVAALNLDAEWAIDQILPTNKNEYFITLEAGREKVLPLKPAIDGKDDFVENTVKVFGTLDAANYRVLELPSLDEPLSFGRGTRSGNSLAALLGAIDDEQPKTRKLTVAASPSTEWTTKQVVLTIAKASD